MATNGYNGNKAATMSTNDNNGYVQLSHEVGDNALRESESSLPDYFLFPLKSWVSECN